MGRCFRLRWKLIAKVSLAAGLPRTSAQGFAHGEPRGHLDRGSNRGRRFAGNVLQYTSFGVLPPSQVCGRKPLCHSMVAVRSFKKRFAPIRHVRQTREQALDRQDNSLHHGNRTMLANRAIARST